MFNLWGKIRLDGTEAKKDAAKAGRGLSQDFGQQFKSGVLRFVGAGAIISLVQRQIQEATEIARGASKSGMSVEGFQVFKAGADELGITVDELKEVAPQLGSKLEKYLDVIEKRGGILDEETINALVMAGQAFNQAVKELAPLIRLSIDVAGRSYRYGSKLAGQSVGAGAAAIGLMTGNWTLMKAGAEQYGENRNAYRQFAIPTNVGTTELTDVTREVATELRRIRADQNRNAADLQNTLTP